MLRLTDNQAAFLNKHDIAWADVLDAKGMRTKDYKALMSSRGYRVAVGVTPCKAHGHVMRGANGHCVMCKPANLMYRKRYREAGYVYIASTEDRTGIVKVGYTKDLNQREKSLNTDRYGGYARWKIIASREATEKGVLENAVHLRLKAHALEIKYFHGNQQQTASELFLVSKEKAVSALRDITMDKAHATLLDGNESKGTAFNAERSDTKSGQNHCKTVPPESTCTKPKPTKKVKVFREIDISKKNETRSARTARKQSKYKTDRVKSRVAQRSQPVSSAALRPFHLNAHDDSDDNVVSSSGEMRWYHKLLL